MSFRDSDTNCTFRCWLIGGIVGLLGLLLLWLVRDHSFIGALFWGIILAVVVGLLLSYLLCRGGAAYNDNGAHGEPGDNSGGSYGATGAAAAGAVGGAAAAAAAVREDSGDGSFRSDAEADLAETAEAVEAAREDSGAASFAAESGDAVADAAGDAVEAVREDSGATSFASDAGDAATDAGEAVADAAGDAGEAIREDSGAASFASDAADAVSDAGEAVADAAGDAVEAVREDSGATSFAAGAGAAAAATKTYADGDYDRDGVVEGKDEGTKPATLTEAREGGADDLKKIKGVGPKLEQLLHRLGFFHFDQIASWTADEVAWVDSNLEGFKGRVSRDNWVEQAKLLAAGGETAFSKKVDKGDVY